LVNSLVFRVRLRLASTNCQVISCVVLYNDYNDLTWCYNILFGYVDVSSDEFFAPSPAVHTRGHPYKLLKKHSNFFQWTCHQRMELSTVRHCVF